MTKALQDKKIFLINVDAKILNKVLTLQKYIKRVLYHDQFKFTPEIQVWFNIQKLTGVICQITSLK